MFRAIGLRYLVIAVLVLAVGMSTTANATVSPDTVELYRQDIGDDDGDGILNYLDPDDNNDGIADRDTPAPTKVPVPTEIPPTQEPVPTEIPPTQEPVPTEIPPTLEPVPTEIPIPVETPIPAETPAVDTPTPPPPTPAPTSSPDTQVNQVVEPTDPPAPTPVVASLPNTGVTSQPETHTFGALIVSFTIIICVAAGVITRRIDNR